MNNKLSDTEVKNIVEEYLSGEKSKTIALKYGVTPVTIIRKLNKNNVTIRNNDEEQRIYKIKESYFDTIDNEQKAYFLGLLFADGCNTGTNITLSLSGDDYYLLDFFQNELYVDKHPRIHESVFKNKNFKTAYKMTICNTHIRKTLNEYGIIKRKSLLLKYPKDIFDLNQFPHFIRGYFDGDGSVWIRRHNQVCYSILSTKEFLIDIAKELIKFNINIENKIYKKGSVFQLTDTKQETVRQFYNFIYKDANIFMKRKKKLFDKILEAI